MPDRVIRTIPVEGETENGVASTPLTATSDVTIGSDELQILFSEWNGNQNLRVDNSLKSRLESYLQFRQDMETVMAAVADQQFAMYCEEKDVKDSKSSIKTFYNDLFVITAEWYGSKAGSSYCYVKTSVFKLILGAARHPLAAYVFRNKPEAYVNVRLWIYNQGGKVEYSGSSMQITMPSSAGGWNV